MLVAASCSSTACRILSLVATVACVTLLSGCGKYGKPLPPEMVAPAAVQQLTVQGQPRSVVLRWSSPKVDRRGKSLHSLTGYRVERAVLGPISAVATPLSQIAFAPIGTVKDESLERLEQSRAQLRATGKPSHRATVDSQYTTFQFTDSQVKTGLRYRYQLIPLSASGDGEVSKVWQVDFTGGVSVIQDVTANSGIEEDALSLEDLAPQSEEE